MWRMRGYLTTLSVLMVTSISYAEAGAAFLSSSFRRPIVKVQNSISNNLEENVDVQADFDVMKITSILKYIGPYPCLALRFPELATPNQKERGQSGISLDFVLDTAANTNTINAMVANELDLDNVGEALPGVAAAGSISGGATFMLGNCQLEDVVGIVADGNENYDDIFMKGLTASALPIASPAAAGLLSVAFLNCFPGGVEFQWGSDAKDKPSVTFYGEASKTVMESYTTRVPITVLEGTGLPSISLRLNGIDVLALLDTGSPITVINTSAAKRMGVSTMQGETLSSESNGNFFSSLTKNFREAQNTANAVNKGDLLLVAGTQGERVELWRTREGVDITCETAQFSNSRIYVGEIPGLGVLGGLGTSSPPAAILGMDILRTIPRMLYRMNEVMF